jgi:serine/threonine protein kinase
MESSARPERTPPDRTARIQVTPTTQPLRPRPADPFEKTVLLRDAAAGGRERNPDSIGDSAQDSLFHLYTIVNKIGDGGMGVVYLAKDKRLGRFVAIKRLNAQGQRVPSLRQRFLQEARAVAALTHIHIVHIYALGEDQDGPYIVMEYIAGPDDKPAGRTAGADRPTPPLTLDQLVARNGQLAVTEAVELLIKVGRAVAYAHSCGVIHRDLKPGNVLLDKSNEPKIVDFGLARLMHSEESKLTAPGEKLLSLGYGAPEQEQDASLSDERADVYGLGALLYFTLTGQNPRYFREQDIPVPFRDVLVKALATDREQRFPSAAAFTEALQATQNKTHVEIPTVKTTWRCKWCDTINPLSLRYCAECGWDGGETCPECGVETFVGVQFCGACGADARTYEALQHMLQRMRAAREQRQFERVLALGSRVHGFEAAGPSGRRMQKEAQELREQAERNLARRDELREQIPLELRAENFERALSFIREIRTLDEDQRLYADEERRIPEQTLARDLGRARHAIRVRDWETATRLCDEILHRFSPENPEGLRLRRRIAIHRILVRTGRIAAALLGLALLYLLSLPPVARSCSTPLASAWRGFYRPAWNCYAAGAFADVLGHYNALWGRPDLAASFAVSTPPEEAAQPAPSAELQRRQTAFSQQLQTIASEQRREADKWPQDYLLELNALAERRRTAGDFDGWSIATAAIKQFTVSRQIGDAPTGADFPELTLLIAKYRDIVTGQRLDRCRRLVATTKKYVNDLAEMQRALTREGKMDDAAAVNAEIRRVQNGGELHDAETELAAAAGASGPAAPAPAAVLPPIEPEKVAALAPLRARYQEQLDGIAADYESKLKLWPAKYKTALEDLMAQFQKQGSYDDWQKAKNELDRFDADQQVQAKDVVTQPPRLAKLQQDHLALLTEHRKVRTTSVLKAAEALIAKLEEMQKKQTLAGNMEVAAAVNAEIKQARNSPEYTAAKQELEPPPPPAPATNRPPAAATGNTSGK